MKDLPMPIYISDDGSVRTDIQIKDETIRLNQKQMSQIFDVNTKTINEHIQNIYISHELKENWTIRKNQIVQTEWNRQVNREVKFYNLDMIISVWYRVNSAKATQFRIRATSILKQYIYDWYAINQFRLQQVGIDDLKKSLEIVSRAIANGDLNNDEAVWLAKLMTIYIPSLITLNQFDTDNLSENIYISDEQKYKLDTQNANEILSKLKQELMLKWEASELFAMDRNDWLGSIFGNIYQSFGDQELYPSVIHKAANLFYMIIKNHPFADGNKRSAAFLFVRYLSQNNLLQDKDGTDKINRQTLVAITILVAISDPKEKEIMIKLIINLVS
jgi:prophage maintenance system killer protein